jgi:hypothetical protein
MKKLGFFVLLLFCLFFVALNTSMISDQAMDWVKNHPKDSNAPEVLYRTARWCDLLGDNKRAVDVYSELYQRYPERGDYCAPALYYLAKIMVDTTSSKIRAKPYLETIMTQYASETEWNSKAKVLYDEVTHVF